MIKKLVPKRVKNAIKCLMGKEINTNPKTHIYKINYEDKKRFEDISALVTGGTGAIGSAICYELAACGAMVGMCGRSESKIREMIDLIRKESPEVANNLIPVVLDVNNDEQIESSIKEFVNKQGKIDVLVNNAGGQPGRVGGYAPFFHEQEISQIDLVLDTNLRGSMMCSKVAAKYMVEQKSGNIINMSSVIGMGGKAGMSDYAAAKAGIIGFTKSLALELGKYNIRVNCISPGFVHQVPLDGGSPIKKTSKNILHRHGYTKEVSDLVCYLVYDKYITGQNYAVDGGRSVGLYGDE